MTFENMVEMVKSSHPDASVTLIKTLINTNLKKFCTENRLLRGKQALLEVGTTPTYTTQTAAEIAAMTGKAVMKGNGSYFGTLATDINFVTGVQYLNSDKRPLYVPDVDMPWYMDGKKNLWFGYSDTTALTEGISGIVVEYIAIPATLSLESDVPTFPEDFHEAIPYMVMMKLHGNANDMARMGFFRQQYNDLRLQAKMWAIQSYQISPDTVVQYDF